jgi:hypothetical protein
MTNWNASPFLSDGAVGLVPTIIVDREFGRQRRFRMSLNLGARIRLATNTFTDNGLAFNDPLLTGMGANVCGPFDKGQYPTPSMFPRPVAGDCSAANTGTGVSSIPTLWLASSRPPAVPAVSAVSAAWGRSPRCSDVDFRPSLASSRRSW